MTRQEAFAAGPVALCDHKADTAAEHAKAGDLGAALGVADWAVEKELATEGEGGVTGTGLIHKAPFP